MPGPAPVKRQPGPCVRSMRVGGCFLGLLRAPKMQLFCRFSPDHSGRAPGEHRADCACPAERVFTDCAFPSFFRLFFLCGQVLPERARSLEFLPKRRFFRIQPLMRAKPGPAERMPGAGEARCKHGAVFSSEATVLSQSDLTANRIGVRLFGGGRAEPRHSQGRQQGVPTPAANGKPALRPRRRGKAAPEPCSAMVRRLRLGLPGDENRNRRACNASSGLDGRAGRQPWRFNVPEKPAILFRQARRQWFH